MENELNVSFSITDKSRLEITVSKNDEIVFSKNVNVIENKAKAKFYNTMGMLWAKVKNQFSSEKSRATPRYKYIPINIEYADGENKLVFVNANSLIKQLLDVRGADREASIKATQKDYRDIFEGVSTEKLDDQGETIRRFVEILVQKNIGATERRTRVKELVARPITEPVSMAIELDPFKPLVFYPSEHAQGEKYKQLCNVRLGLSGTATGQGGGEAEATKSRKNWEATDTLVAQWAESREPLTLDKILKINEMLCEGLENNGGKAGVLRKPGQEVWAGGRTYLAGSHVQGEMETFVQWLEKGLEACDNGKNNPILLAAQACQRLVSIHPFSDGNGRTTRMVMDYILQRYGLPPAALKDANVAVFGESDFNIDCDKAVLIVKAGIEEACRLLEVEAPFKT